MPEPQEMPEPQDRISLWVLIALFLLLVVGRTSPGDTTYLFGIAVLAMIIVGLAVFAGRGKKWRQNAKTKSTRSEEEKPGEK
jgi:hypothetical protein